MFPPRFPVRWLQQWWRRHFGAGRPVRSARRLRRPPTRLLLEGLETRLAPAVSFSIADPAPFPEGDTGTTDLIFLVTRSGDLAPPLQADFTTQDGTRVTRAHAATHY